MLYKKLGFKTGAYPAIERVVLGSGQVLSLLALLIVLVFPTTATATTEPLHRAEQLGLQLLAKERQWQRSGKAQVVAEMHALAVERRAIMESLISAQPVQALRLAIPSNRRGTLPAAVASELENTEVLEGELTVLIHDHPDRSTSEYRLRTAGGELRLHFAGQGPQLLSGQRVRVRGLRLGQAVAVSEDSGLSVLSLNGENDQVSSSSAPLSNTFGEQRVVVILVNFQDNPADQPYTVEQAHELVFGTVDGFYRETSSQRTWLGGSVYGWLTMPHDQPTDSAGCSAFNLSTTAEQTAIDAGVPLADYDRHIYVFPATPCYAAGTGTVGGWPSKAWINGAYFDLQTTAHELGHNLGLHHSGALECGVTSEGEDCSVSTYGDQVDVMGNADPGHFNAYKKERLGWLNEAAGEIVHVSTGSYSLSPFELSHDSGTQALKILTGSNSSTGENTWYYLEYRQAIGADAFLAEGNHALDGNTTDGILVRRVTTPSDDIPVSSLLLDMTPENDPYFDWVNFALEDGQTYTDPASGISISTVSTDSNGAVVTIGNGSVSSCVRGQPELRVLSAQSQWASPGSIAQYQLEVVNQDSVACGDSDIDLSAASPAGWYNSFDQSSPRLAPGTATTVYLDVSSSGSAAVGYYDIALAAVHGTSGYSGSAAVTYVVESNAPANQAPVAVDDSASTAQNTAVDIAVLDNDYDADGTSPSISGYGSAKSGSVSLLSNGRLRYSPRKKFKGNDSFSYTISDGELTSTATVSIAVGGSGGDGGSTGGGNKGKGGGKNR